MLSLYEKFVICFYYKKLLIDLSRVSIHIRNITCRIVNNAIQSGIVSFSSTCASKRHLRKQVPFAMISVPGGTGDICSANDIRFADDIRCAYEGTDIISFCPWAKYHTCKASISYRASDISFLPNQRTVPRLTNTDYHRKIL